MPSGEEGQGPAAPARIEHSSYASLNGRAVNGGDVDRMLPLPMQTLSLQDSEAADNHEPRLQAPSCYSFSSSSVILTLYLLVQLSSTITTSFETN